MILTKLSEPGWERDFASIEDLYVVLRNGCCLQCREEADMMLEWAPTTENKVCDLAATDCGCEYWIDVKSV